MKKLILSPSYFTAPLFILLLVNKKYASYFFPYVAITSIIGIIVKITIMIDKDKKKIWDSYFSSNTSNQFTDKYQNIVYLFVIIFKLIVIKYWPYNISYLSVLISLLYLCLYFVYYLNI